MATLLEAVLHETGYLEALAAERTIEAEGRVENLGNADRRRRRVRHRARARGGERDARRWRSTCSRSPSTPSRTGSRAEQELVTLMTLHNAKGLEYDTVFIVGCEEGAFPHMRALEEGGEEEERRLCYVGITRARKRLYMTWARERRLFGRAEHNLPSRFIDELPARADRAPLDRRPQPRGHQLEPAAIAAPTRRTPASTRPGAGAADRRRRRPRQLRRRRRHRGRARRGGRRPLRRRRLRAQADGRLRPDPEALEVAARVIDGKAVAAAVRERVAVEVAAYAEEAGRAPGLATVLVGEDPASEIYVRNKRRRTARRSGCARSTTSLRGGDRRGGAAGPGPRARRRRRGRRHPRAAAAPGAHRPRRRRRRDRPGKDVDGLTPINAGLLAHGTPGPGPLHARRGDGAAAPRGGRAGGGRGGRRRPLEAGRRAGRAAAAGGQRDRDRSATRAPATSPAICRRADVLVAAVGVAATARRRGGQARERW